MQRILFLPYRKRLDKTCLLAGVYAEMYFSLVFEYKEMKENAQQYLTVPVTGFSWILLAVLEPQWAFCLFNASNARLLGSHLSCALCRERYHLNFLQLTNLPVLASWCDFQL